MKSCCARWNPSKLGWNLRRAASDEIKSVLSPREAGFHREAISSTAGGFIPSARTDLVEKSQVEIRLGFFLGAPLQNRSVFQGVRINFSLGAIMGFSHFHLFFVSLGITKSSINATTNTTATQFCAKIDWTIWGNLLNISGTRVKPTPILRESDAIVMFLSEKPHFTSIWIPLITMLPNIIMVHPPRTDSGKVERTIPKAGKNPARIMIPAPVAIV